MKDLPLEKQLSHRYFCDAIQNIEDLEELKNQIGNKLCLLNWLKVLFLNNDDLSNVKRN